MWVDLAKFRLFEDFLKVFYNFWGFIYYSVQYWTDSAELWNEPTSWEVILLDSQFCRAIFAPKNILLRDAFPKVFCVSFFAKMTILVKMAKRRLKVTLLFVVAYFIENNFKWTGSANCCDSICSLSKWQPKVRMYLNFVKKVYTLPLARLLPVCNRQTAYWRPICCWLGFMSIINPSKYH